MYKSVLGKINKLQKNIFEKPKIIIHRLCLLGLSAQLNILLHLHLPSPNIDYQVLCGAGVTSYIKILIDRKMNPTPGMQAAR
jgi:hypothetical protein